MKPMWLLAVTILAVALSIAAAQVRDATAVQASANEALFEAARAGDVARIEAALAQGANVNATARYNVTPLTFAASNGRFDAVRLLVSKGANVNAEDTFYRATAAEMALSNGHPDIALFLFQNGWNGADDLMRFGVQSDNAALVATGLGGKVSRHAVQTAINMAEKLNRSALLPDLKAALDKLPADAASNAPPAPSAPGASTSALASPSATVNKPNAPNVPNAPGAPRNWPSFRGGTNSGNGDGQRVPSEWDIATRKNIKWKTPIPGLANSSPIVWGNRVFVTTAISKTGDNSFRTGLYGDVKPVDDLSEHEWKIYALDKATGRIVWERTAFVGAPKIKRHTKATQANSTPATDGRHIVAAFGTIGLLIAWDISGKELWRVDTGPIDSGWFFDPTFQWGHSSSPIIYRNSVILQADAQKGSYIAAWDLATGKRLWKTERVDEIPTWGTPALLTAPSGRSELVTNGTKIRGYDPSTGKLLWTLGPNSEVTVGTPVTAHGLAFVTGGYPPVRPIYAIRPGGSGDISLPKGSESSDAIAWSNMTDGTYIPTPLPYRQHLITMNNNGIVNAYDARTGARAFRGRIGTGGAFSASPVAADGRLFAASEDGEIYVVSAAPGLAQIAKNEMKEVIMATPAISDGMIIVRTFGHVYGIGE